MPDIALRVARKLGKSKFCHVHLPLQAGQKCGPEMSLV
jgi:hypothetical protein